MNREEILSHVDHTLLKPEATWPQIQQLCDEAIANHTASVCINTCYVKQAVEYMAGRIPVCCVVGFPLGAMDTASKAFEAKTAIENGAAEVDMVINIGRLKNKEYDAIREDIRAVKELTILAESEEAGVFLAIADEGRKIFVMGHPEYDRVTLDKEYKRDKDKGLDIKMPVNYYPNDDDTQKPRLQWRSHGNILYSNWLNYYVYQTTPFQFINTDEIVGK